MINNEMNLGKRGKDLIKSFEKLRLISYRPTPNDVWTIGWGHTNGVREGMTIDEATAERFLTEDVRKTEVAINDAGAKLTQSMFDAIVSLCFNVGIRAVSDHATIGRAIRSGDWIDAWRGFDLWTATSGAELGLARRRSREMALFLEDGWPTS